MINLSTPCTFLPNKPEKNGYVRRGARRPGFDRSAHRQAYVEAYGPIPPEHTVDHECHNQSDCRLGDRCPHRSCVNPLHLVAVPGPDNTRAARGDRITECPAGHPYTPGNTVVDDGGKRCRFCVLLDHQRRQRERKALEWGLSLDDISNPESAAA